MYFDEISIGLLELQMIPVLLSGTIIYKYESLIIVSIVWGDACYLMINVYGPCNSKKVYNIHAY